MLNPVKRKALRLVGKLGTAQKQATSSSAKDRAQTLVLNPDMATAGWD